MNIYVGNLNYKVREDDLVQLLAEYGTVDSARVIMDRETNRSKGFGFAEMPDDEAARRAIEELAEKEFFGRRLIIKEALPKKQ